MTTTDASLFRCLAPCYFILCLISCLEFHWERGTDSLDADWGMRGESIEAYKSNFTSQPSASEPQQLPTADRNVCLFICVQVWNSQRMTRVCFWSGSPSLRLSSLPLSDLCCSLCDSLSLRSLSFPTSALRLTSRSVSISSVLQHQTSSSLSWRLHSISTLPLWWDTGSCRPLLSPSSALTVTFLFWLLTSSCSLSLCLRLFHVSFLRLNIY